MTIACSNSPQPAGRGDASSIEQPVIQTQKSAPGGFSALDMDFIPNYSLHVIDPKRMIETKRVCTALDSPNVRLEQIGESLRFRATSANYDRTFVEIANDYEVKPYDIGTSEAIDESQLKPGDDDPTVRFGDLPDMYPISVAARGKDGRSVYYSVDTGPEGTFLMTTIVRYDLRMRQVTGRLTLSRVGCEDDHPVGAERVQYLFVDRHGMLIALAGSDAEWVP